MTNDQLYHLARAKEEGDAAMSAADAHIRDLHLRLSKMHMALVDGGFADPILVKAPTAS